MNIHVNARLTPVSRELLCRRVREEGWTVAEASYAAGVSERTAYRWLARYDAGEPMTDRSSAGLGPEPDPTEGRGHHRAAAPDPDDLHRDRREGGDGRVDGGRGPGPCGVEPAVETGTAVDAEPVCPPSRGGVDPLRYQDPGPVHQARQACPRPGPRPQIGWGWFGGGARRGRRRHAVTGRSVGHAIGVTPYQ